MAQRHADRWAARVDDAQLGCGDPPLGRGGERLVHVAGAQKQEASIAADACTVAPEHARVERHGGAGGRRQERTKGG
eukprot:CAMPEP_0119531214 /NCGR_PEP_ID=MMETSP1344-20130328/44942_1 /TAXON_ID=236787 /ORGANISM="Florenciella parvula, Strain CCMP2471" /LENGTH=76 /DNA_ID=CAMNT_0007571399 /DNA_START=64 /DNA_END=290 /DNA_ORIENTATION=-